VVASTSSPSCTCPSQYQVEHDADLGRDVRRPHFDGIVEVRNDNGVKVPWQLAEQLCGSNSDQAVHRNRYPIPTRSATGGACTTPIVAPCITAVTGMFGFRKETGGSSDPGYTTRDFPEAGLARLQARRS